MSHKVRIRKEKKDRLTMSVSDTGPKLVTWMFVLTSVTLSEGTDNKEQGNITVKCVYKKLCCSSVC